MKTWNEAIGETCDVSAHAKQRWEERFRGLDMERSLSRAVPFGGQFKGDMLLLDEERQAAFATRPKGRYRLVLTVLTKEQALVNLQNSHQLARLGKVSHAICAQHRAQQLASTEQDTASSAPAASSHKQRIWTDGNRVSKLTDAELLDLEELVLAERQSDGSLTYGAIKQRIDNERRYRKAKKHAERMERQKRALIAAIQQLLHPDQWDQIFDLADALSEEQKCLPAQADQSASA